MKKLILTFLLMGLGSTCWAQSFAIVTSSNSPFSKVSADEMRDLYLGRLKFLEKNRVTLLHHAPDFSSWVSKVLHKNERQYKSLWKMRVFTGKSKKIKSFTTKEQLFRELVKAPKSLAYIAGDAVEAEGIKTIAVIQSSN